MTTTSSNSKWGNNFRLAISTLPSTILDERMSKNATPRTYSEAELQSLLGKPARRGVQPSNLGPWPVNDLTALSASLQGEYLEWDCGSLDSEPYQCVAISMERESRDLPRRWYVINTCGQHLHDLELTPFSSAYGFPEYMPPRLVAITLEAWNSGTGTDYEEMVGQIDLGWHLFHADTISNVPGYIFVVLTPPDPQPEN